MKYCISLLSLLISLAAIGQNVTIDYQSWNPSGTTCSLFVNPTNVPATGTTSGTIEHQRKLGQTEYNSTDLSIQMQTIFQTTGAVYKGARYRIAYNFKAGYSYIIYVTAAAVENTVGFPTGPFIRLDVNNNGGGGSTGCNGPESLNPNAGGNPAAVKLSSNSFQEFQFIFPPLGAQPTLEITAFPAENGGTKTVRIRKIRIVETPPTPTFTITQSPTPVPCGSTAQVSFTVNNVYSSPGTLAYDWNLGTSNNGWLYNGNPAPQTFSTTTNSINLTPASGSAVLSNVSVTVKLNGSNYTTLTSTVSRSSGATQGSYLPMTGSSIVCGSSENYSLTGVPAGATVSWSLDGVYTNGSYLPLQNVCTLSSSGTQATLTKINNGTVTLRATITNCDGIQQYSSKSVTFGVPELYGNAGYYIDNIYLTQPVEGTATFLSSSSFYITLESSGTNTYVWESSSSSNANYYFGYTGNNFATCWWSTPLNPYDYFGFTVHTTNACGTRSDPMYFYYDGPYQYYRVAPNPVKSTFYITQVSFKSNPIPKGKKQINVDLLKIQIVDKMGNVVLEQFYPSETKSTTVNTSSLKSDIYTVRLFTQDKKIESHRIIIQH